MASCNSPRPITLKVSWPSSSTLMETLVSSSLSSRSRRLRDVTHWPSRPGEGRRVDGERHGDGGLVDVDGRQRLGRFGVGHGLADGDAFHAGDGQDVARPADGFVHALQPFEGVELGDLGGVEGAVALGDGHRCRHTSACP